MRISFLLIFLFFTFGCRHPESEGNNRYRNNSEREADIQKEIGFKVIGIKDGDTFVLLVDGKEEVVRLAHIDCPEKRQPYGTKAKEVASSLCFGKNVLLKHDGKRDRNKRLIAEILLLDSTVINQELVRKGLAWHYKKYSSDEVYAYLELEARQQRVGLWSESEPIPPWEWRNKKN